nr:hypothetical protein [Lysobacter profundi]
MFSAAELIDVVIGRGRSRHWLRAGEPVPAGEFPPAWQAWFARMGEHLGAITGATAEAIIAVLMRRELSRPPRRAGELNRWQAFATLWRQQWMPPEREERHVRWTAAALTLIAHLILVAILLWLASVRFMVTSAPQGEEVVQVEYVGQGTPEETGGGAPKAGAAEPATVAAPQTPSPRPPRKAVVREPAAAQAAATQPEASSPAAPVAEIKPAPTPPQPLQVSQVPVPDRRFSLPPPTPRAVELPKAQIAEPALQVPIRDIELARQPSPSPAPVPTPPVPAAVAPTTAPPKVVVEPAVPSPLAVTPPTTQPPAPSPSPPAASTTTTAIAPPRPATGTAPASTSSVVGGKPAATASAQSSQAAIGAGATSTPKPGAQPTPLRADDWGASARNRPGGNTGTQPGLFNADGSPRLSAGTAQPGGGFPPGSDHWTHEQFDRAGTWLRRPPNDYTPTRFDKVWVPSETLLEEWVRRNVRTVSIPIPGTSKKLECKVSLLQLGGGCTISDPNMNDQEATARPPPDIPFKPDLQEDQRSLRKPGSP